MKVRVFPNYESYSNIAASDFDCQTLEEAQGWCADNPPQNNGSHLIVGLDGERLLIRVTWQKQRGVHFKHLV